MEQSPTKAPRHCSDCGQSEADVPFYKSLKDSKCCECRKARSRRTRRQRAAKVALADELLANLLTSFAGRPVSEVLAALSVPTEKEKAS